MVDSGNGYKSQILSPLFLRTQSLFLDIPLLIFNANSIELEANYILSLNAMKKHKMEGGVFGSISNEDQKSILQKLCESQNMIAEYPLWQQNKKELLIEFIEIGFKAKIIAVNEKILSREYLGKDLTLEVAEDLIARKIDLFAENSEFHTLVYEAPFFVQTLNFKEGDIHLRNGYWILDLLPTN